MLKRPDGFCSKNTGGYRSIFSRRREMRGGELEVKSSKSIFNFSDSLMAGIDALWRQKLMCDVILVVENKSLLAHKLVLASCSDFFFEKFSEGKEKPGSYQFELLDVKATAMMSILECMYSGRISLTQNTVKDVLSAATILGFLGIHEACEQYLTEHLSVENCFSYMDTAYTYDLQMLLEKSTRLIANNFEKISKKSEFRYVPVEQLLSMLRRNDLRINNEYAVFECVLRWIDVDRQRRIEYAAELLSTVRLPLLSPSEIIDKVESVGCLKDIPDCQKLVKEALHYHCMPCRQTLLQTERTEPRLPYRDNCLMVVGGAPRVKTERVSCDINVLDLEDLEGKWRLTACLPEPRHHHAVAVMNGFLYVVGGEVTNNHGFPSNSAFRYDPRHDSWLQIANMKHRRESFQLAISNNMLYAVGGKADKSKSLSSVERYDPNNDEWNLVAPLSSPKHSIAVAALGGFIYAVGGAETKIISSRVERYSYSNNIWEIRKPVNTPRFYGHLSPIGNHLFLIGGATIDGQDAVVCVETIERYTPQLDVWVIFSKNPFPTPRSESGCAVINDKIYIAGGYNWNKKQRTTSVECYDTSTDSWCSLQPLGKKYTGAALCSFRIYDFYNS